MRTMYLGLVLLSTAAVAAAQDPEATANPEMAVPAAGDAAPVPADDRICVTRTMIGSNMPRRICRSAAQVRKDGKRPALPVDPSITLDNFEGRAGQN